MIIYDIFVTRVGKRYIKTNRNSYYLCPAEHLFRPRQLQVSYQVFGSLLHLFKTSDENLHVSTSPLSLSVVVNCEGIIGTLIYTNTFLCIFVYTMQFILKVALPTHNIILNKATGEFSRQTPTSDRCESNGILLRSQM